MANPFPKTNPRKLRVMTDDEGVTLYLNVPPEAANSIVSAQSLQMLHAEAVLWFRTSFMQIMYKSDYYRFEVVRPRVLALRITYIGLEDVLKRASLGRESDLTTYGRFDRNAPVRIVWEGSVNAVGHRNKKRRCMLIGLSKPIFVQLTEKEILSIEDVTAEADTLRVLAAEMPPVAHEFALRYKEEHLPVDNYIIEWNLGML